MINARKSLMRHLTTFFRSELLGVFAWGEVKVHEPEPATERDEDHPLRDSVFGRHRELVSVSFGDYRLDVHSSVDKPPLGLVILTGVANGSGPLSSDTWQMMGQKIREAERSHESNRKRQDQSGQDPVPGWGRADL